MNFLNFSYKRRKCEIFLEGWFCKETSVSLSPTVSASCGGGRNEILSCVARAEPRNKLCGMTVAPRIPTAMGAP